MVVFINVEELLMHTLAGNVWLAQECRQKSQFPSPLWLCHTHFMESLLLLLAQ